MTCIVVGLECLCSLFNANAFFIHFFLVAPRQQDTDGEAKAILNKREKPYIFY